MTIETLAYIFAGLGLFFVGLKLLKSGLQKATSRKMRQLMAQWTRKVHQGGLIGLLSGILTQSMPALTFVVSSMISAGMIKMHQALPVIFWGNIGCTILIFIAFMDIKILTLLIIGLAGIAYSFEKPRNYSEPVQIVFGLGLILFGLFLVRSNASSFAEADWFRSLLGYAVYAYPLAFLLGVILSAIAQSSSAISIIAISMATTGLLTVDQAMLIAYGANFGSSVLTYLLSTSIKGTPKQLVMGQVMFNMVSVPIFLLLFILEFGLGIPLVGAFSALLTNSLEMQLASIVLMLNFTGAFFLTLFIRPFARFLERFWPATQVEEWGKLAYLNDNVLNNPESALPLIELEQNRLIDRMSLYMEAARFNTAADSDKMQENLHNAFNAIARELQACQEEIFRKNLNHKTSEELITLSGRMQLLSNLDQLLYDLTALLRESSQSDTLNQRITAFIEGLGFLLITLKETATEPDRESPELLLLLSADRGNMMKKMRKNYLAAESSMSKEERTVYLQLTSLFERAVWLINRLAASLQKNESA